MKDLAKYDVALGSDGKAKAAIGVEADQLVIAISASYPIAKIIEPATTAIDNLLTKLEALIPGDWDKPLIEKVKAEYKVELIKLLSEGPAVVATAPVAEVQA